MFKIKINLPSSAADLFAFCLFSLIALASQSALSASTNWSFNELGDCGNPVCFTSNAGYTDNGFVFERYLEGPDSLTAFGYYGSDNSAYDGGGLLGATNSYFRLYRQDGNAFDIESLTLRGGLDTATPASIELNLSVEFLGGATLATNFSKNTSNSSYENIANANWKNIVALTISDDGTYFGASSVSYEFDSIQMTAVPVPAAFWMYTFALLGLTKVRGRNRQTLNIR